jgi:ABC-type lipoprotein export system ATPase subunit
MRASSGAVEIRGLFRVYSTPEGDAAALQGLTLDVRQGETVSVLGPSGAGKTTLLRIVAGLDRPSAGTVRVFGLDLAHATARALARYRASAVGYVDQHYSRALAPELAARELVALKLRLSGTPRRQRLARADELLERVGLAGRARSRAAELSGGEQQRIAVCAALAHRPRLLLADEPTGELDEASARLVYGAIAELVREHDCTALIVSHDPASTMIADRTVRVRDGRVSEESGSSASEELVVVGRGGWLRIPEELLHRAGIGPHARADLDNGNIVLSAAGRASVDVVATPRPAAPSVTPADGVVELRRVEKTYGQGRAAVHALAGLTVSFEPGCFHTVTGPSGSGKTTLLQLIGGLELPTSGEVELLGRIVSSLDREERARFRREHVGVVSQQAGLIPGLSARENVELALAVRSSGERASERATEALAAAGLGERVEQRVSRLSSGEQARVAIARAVATRPALLLVDEPTARLDQGNALALASLFRRLAGSGVTVICATHDPLVIEQADNEFALARRAPHA